MMLKVMIYSTIIKLIVKKREVNPIYKVREIQESKSLGRNLYIKFPDLIIASKAQSILSHCPKMWIT